MIGVKIWMFDADMYIEEVDKELISWSSIKNVVGGVVSATKTCSAYAGGERRETKGEQ